MRLSRTLELHGLGLAPTDGFRTHTAYEAYPVALEVVRRAKGEIVRDHASRTFIELADFRIHLTNPAVDKVPRYHQRDADRLEKYFVKEFCEPSGIFYEGLNYLEQLSAVLDHLVTAIKSGSYTTRRAVLIVPHIVKDPANLSPLGLISVRVIPRRAAGGGTRLDFSFTWRTVEAIVGLPYSLYGSIRYAEYVTDKLQQLLSAYPAFNVRMGQLSYIAHSLHMYETEYAAKVARAIVNDETR